VVGFPFFDQDVSAELSAAAAAFLAAGERPVVFTLGSSVVRLPTTFFAESYEAIKAVGCRAIFLVGDNDRVVPAATRSDPRVLVSKYEPFSRLFPAAAAVVHQCGIGTTSQALRSGIPQVLCPFAHDQPDNAARVVRHGCGVALDGYRVRAGKMAGALRQILGDDTFRRRGQEFAAGMRHRDFPTALGEAVEGFLPFG
jgi:UDP:flavonoid glycosyltransferase YjiC (YdhE family)